MNSFIEVFLITFSNDFYYSYQDPKETISSINPDDIVLDIALNNGFVKEQLISHSTSWRYDKNREIIILTYIVFQPDIYIEDGKIIIINQDKINHGLSYHPSPDTILIDEVLMHGLRHLEFLINKHELSVPSEVFKLLSPLRIELAGKF